METEYIKPETLSIAKGKLIADKFANTPILGRMDGGTIKLNEFVLPLAPCEICGKEAMWYKDFSAFSEKNGYKLEDEHYAVLSRCEKHITPDFVLRTQHLGKPEEDDNSG